MPLVKLMRIGFLIAVFAFAGAWVYGFNIESRFPDYPLKPDYQAARVLPHKWKSVTIFVSNEEAEGLAIAHMVELASALSASCCLLVWQLFNTKNSR